MKTVWSKEMSDDSVSKPTTSSHGHRARTTTVANRQGDVGFIQTLVVCFTIALVSDQSINQHTFLMRRSSQQNQTRRAGSFDLETENVCARPIAFFPVVTLLFISATDCMNVDRLHLLVEHTEIPISRHRLPESHGDGMDYSDMRIFQLLTNHWTDQQPLQPNHKCAHWVWSSPDSMSVATCWVYETPEHDWWSADLTCNPIDTTLIQANEAVADHTTGAARLFYCRTPTTRRPETLQLLSGNLSFRWTSC